MWGNSRENHGKVGRGPTKESPECQAEEFASRSAKVSHARFELQEDVIKGENHLK